jgi:hypothetical protein
MSTTQEMKAIQEREGSLLENAIGELCERLNAYLVAAQNEALDLIGRAGAMDEIAVRVVRKPDIYEVYFVCEGRWLFYAHVDLTGEVGVYFTDVSYSVFSANEPPTANLDMLVDGFIEGYSVPMAIEIKSKRAARHNPALN